MGGNEWKDKQNKLLKGDPTKSIKPKRQYIHFDTKIKAVTDEIVKDIFDRQKVATHDFYPFITYVKKIRRRKKKDGVFVGYESKPRDICYASHFDTLLYSWYAHQLNYLYERELLRGNLTDNVLAYRSGNGSNVDHACKAFRVVSAQEEVNVVCADISGFFDNLDHELLKKQWLYLLQTVKPGLKKLPNDHFQVFKNITRFAIVNLKSIYTALGLDEKTIKKQRLQKLCDAKDFRTKIAQKHLIYKNKNYAGIPQGSSISATLANLYMLEFDKKLKETIEKIRGSYYRYSDDIMIIVPKDTLEISEIESLLQDEIQNVKLAINNSKNEVYSVRREKGLQVIRNPRTGRKKTINYLGMSFDGKKILFKHASLAGYQRRAMSSVRAALRFHFRENKPVPKRSINKRFTKLGKQNFQSYVRRATRALKDSGFVASHLEKQASDFFVHKAVRNEEIKKAVQVQVARREARKNRRKANF